jgi:Tfp pilus assembly protein PilF/peroxiredoxin
MLLALAAAGTAWGPRAAARAADEAARADTRVYDYAPKQREPPALEPILRNLAPGNDAFPEEKVAEELAERLNELSALLRDSPRRAHEAADRLLSPEAKGRLAQGDEVPVGESSALEIFRSRASSNSRLQTDQDRRVLGEELGAFLGAFETIQVAEFLVTAIELYAEPAPAATTQVRYDIVGSGKRGGREEQIGRWRMEWRRGGDGAWRVASWTGLDHVRSRALAPAFTEVSAAALDRNPAFRQQLGRGLDEWVTRLDGVFTVGGMGHHGVSVGDADGDGLDDLYVAQPSGLPNRLFRNQGDGTFADVTEAAGLAVLDSTSQSLFADVDNDGDKDLVLVTRSGLLLFTNDGKGHFTHVADAFRTKGALKGSPTSIAMADYDRDGFLDVYLCTYSYFIGASEDKAGQPTPYHDAQNGPPNVLFKNDGHGRFVEVTNEVGLDENNNRYSFAASWADYDEDGWPDLLVANDFGRKNLYHNEGMKDGTVRFKDVAGPAGVEDYGAGMSAAWLDYDNDGHLDIYTGNMWTATGQRVTAAPGFMPDAPAEVRGLYRRHARGNSLFRNRGDGTFEDVTLAARAEFGRWAWSSDAFDFDSDGWEDLYVVNGMFTRAASEQDVDLDSFFWRQVTARSPLTSRAGTAFDDAWRATNRLLAAHGSQARHERDVFLRNDGKGGFDEVSGTVGLDLDGDGRSFAVADYDLDGDPDLVVMSARSAPQLRIFRNDYPEKNASLALRLVGSKSNRDAVGARVVVETDDLRRTKIVLAGSGFISQHSQELLFGLGKSKRILKVEILWPSGTTQTLSDVAPGRRVWITEGSSDVRSEPLRAQAPSLPSTVPQAEAPAPPATGTWLYRPYPAPDFTLRDLEGGEHTLSRLRGRPVLLCFWSAAAPPSQLALAELALERQALATAGATLLAVAVDAPEDEAKVRAAARDLGIPVAMASHDVAGTYSILNRYLFDRRLDLRLPTILLLDAQGQVAKVYRDRIAAAQVLADIPKIEASPAERLARALPFRGTFYASPGERNYFQSSLDLSEQGFDAAALQGFLRVAALDPSAMTFYNVGTLQMKLGQPTEARASFERALTLDPGYAEASNSLGALLAQSGDVPAAIARFRAALENKPDFPDALNNLGYALFQTERDDAAYDLYQKALALQPEFPEALNNLGILFGQQGDLDRAESYFKQAVAKRPDYGEAANNLALVLGARGDTDGAILVLKRLLEQNPGFEMAYVTLAKVYLAAGRQREGTQVLELLLQRNPKHALGLQILRELKGGR